MRIIWGTTLKSLQTEQRGKLKGPVFGMTKPGVTLNRFTWRKHASGRVLHPVAVNNHLHSSYYSDYLAPDTADHLQM